MPAPAAFRSITTATHTTTATWTVNKPSGVVDGDLLIVALGLVSGTTVNTVPAGWTLVSRTVFSTQELFIYAKVASGEGASWNWVFATTPTGGSHCLAFSNPGPGSAPYTDGGTSISATSALAAPSVNPLSAQDLLLVVYFSRTSSAGSMTQPIGMTERADTAPQSTRCIASNTEALTSNAATGTRSTFVTNFNVSGIAQTILIHSPRQQGSPLMMSM